MIQNKNVLGARVPKEHYDFIQDLAIRRMDRPSDLIRLAIAEFVESRKQILATITKSETNNG